MQLILGDCSKVLSTFDDNSIDSVVTDPPYGLAFMGKKWDYDVPSVDVWREVFRVLKPGGHLLSFGGTRTYHRMVVNVEDAGFEIRDSLMWHVGSGFPKSLDVRKAAIKSGIGCACEKPEYEVRPVRDSNIPESVNSKKKQWQVLQHSLSQQSSSEIREERPEPQTTKRKEPGLEGRRVRGATKGLCNGKDAESSESKTERICFRAHFDSGTDTWTFFNERRGSSSQESQSVRQQAGEFRDIQDTQRALDEAPLPRCSRCKKSIFPKGFGTALKPATEIICLARKPLIGTVVQNVEKYGTGAMNIDQSRVPANYDVWEKEKSLCASCAGNAEKKMKRTARMSKEYTAIKNVDQTLNENQIGLVLDDIRKTDTGCLESISLENINVNLSMSMSGNQFMDQSQKERSYTTLTKTEKIIESKICKSCHKVIMRDITSLNTDREKSETQSTQNAFVPNGRWPSNCLFDEDAAKMLDAQSGNVRGFSGGGGGKTGIFKTGKVLDHYQTYCDSGGASRFFYCAKASRSERNCGEKEQFNSHATVKPLKLMEYLVKLITPPNGTVLDPFMGSGTTGLAAKNLGFDFVGIELNEEYIEIAKRRIL